MSEQPSLGLVIPSENEEQYLSDTLKSIFNQNSPFVEVVVVNDSSDGSN